MVISPGSATNTVMVPPSNILIYTDHSMDFYIFWFSAKLLSSIHLCSLSAIPVQCTWVADLPSPLGGGDTTDGTRGGRRSVLQWRAAIRPSSNLNHSILFSSSDLHICIRTTVEVTRCFIIIFPLYFPSLYLLLLSVILSFLFICSFQHSFMRFVCVCVCVCVCTQI